VRGVNTGECETNRITAGNIYMVTGQIAAVQLLVMGLDPYGL
jgi:hypothetical protein